MLFKKIDSFLDLHVKPSPSIVVIAIFSLLGLVLYTLELITPGILPLALIASILSLFGCLYLYLRERRWMVENNSVSIALFILLLVNIILPNVFILFGSDEIKDRSVAIAQNLFEESISSKEYENKVHKEESGKSYNKENVINKVIFSTPTLVPTAPHTPMVSIKNVVNTTNSPEIPKLIFGIGPEADAARDSNLNNQVNLEMYTSWFNGTNDLNWMRYWKSDFIPSLYRSGKTLHLIVYSDDPETGAPCGRQYPIGDQISKDMQELADIFKGSASDKPLYVTLFTEFQTFPCVDNQWQGAEEYYSRLQQKMIEIRNIFRSVAPNSKVSIGWGGWQARWDDPSKGAGRSLISKFDSVNKVMDFQSFQAMQADSNVEDIRAMTKVLGAYGPVMLAHHKPDGFYPDVFEKDIDLMMNDEYLRGVTANGLFGWSFMDEREMNHSSLILSKVVKAVQEFGY